MPHKVFKAMLIAILTFFVLTVTVVVFNSLVDTSIEDKGGIFHLDLALIAQLAIQWFNILLLTFFLMHILYNPVRKFMIDRAERIKNDIETAKQNNEDSQKLRAEYEAKLAEIAKEREEILAKAHRESMDEHDRIIFDAQKQADHLKQTADDEIKVQRENAADEVRRQIIEISTLMAGRFVQKYIDNEIQDQYIDDALKDWSGQKWQV